MTAGSLSPMLFPASLTWEEPGQGGVCNFNNDPVKITLPSGAGQSYTYNSCHNLASAVNVGRGTAIDQEALCDALNAGQLAGAALDVVVPEPLPADHPLRRAKNLLLTPHVAGNMTLGYTCDKSVQMFCDDLENYAAGRPLAHLVDRKRGY